MGILKKDYAENIDFGKAGAILKEILKWNIQKNI